MTGPMSGVFPDPNKERPRDSEEQERRYKPKAIPLPERERDIFVSGEHAGDVAVSYGKDPRIRRLVQRSIHKCKV